MTTTRSRPSSVRDTGLELSRRELCIELRALRLVVQQLVAELRAQRQDHERRRQRPSRAGLLSAIATSVGDREFTAAEVLRHAEVDPALATALDRAELTTARLVAKFFQQVKGRTIDGVRVEPIGKDGDGSILWRV